ncbi:MAG: hypothetical protein IKN02_01485 [Prevotella sp.]|nr:hypothetical protein [Prevotella sp.]
MKKLLTLLLVLLSVTTMSAATKAVFLYAGQSNADGREYVQNLPDYMKQGTSPYSPYTHLKWASICGNPKAKTFGTRQMSTGERYAFCDVTNYWIDQSAAEDFYAIKCAYGGTAIAPGVTADKLPIWYADAEWMTTHNAYDGSDITQAANANKNSLTKNLTEGFASLVDGTLAAVDGGYDVKAIMWHQGESDRNASGSYYENFKTMIAYMRQAIYAKTGDEADLTLPFIFGTVCRRSTQYSAGVETAQRKVAQEDPNVFLIDMQNATLKDDNLHFDKQATDYLGKKMYNQLVSLGLVSGEAVDVEEFPVKTSVMDDVEVPSPDNRSWDFTAISQATLDALEADKSLSSGALWNYNSGWGYRRGNSIEEEKLHTAAGYIIPETEGLYFTSSVYNRLSITSNSLGFVSSDAHLLIPKMVAGQLVTFTVRANKNTINVNPDLDTQSLVELVSETNTVGTTATTVTYRVRYNVTVPTHMGFTMGNAFLQMVQITTPNKVNILIGADQKETFSCDQPLDFSPFTDLFKAYVVTGYDDASGKVDCEQVLQVPANTGVLLIGEESTVNAPIIEGEAPAAPAVNLLTAVVGEGSAPAGSFVLTTSDGVTQFTKAGNAVSLNSQAYIASLGESSAYGFNLYTAKTEHVYDISSGSILAKGTKLTFTNDKHHSATDGSKSVDLYGPANAVGLEGRFAFDNSGNWSMDDNNYRLGANTGKTLYCSVVKLENGDRVKLEWAANSTSEVHVYDLGGILRGVSAGGEITNGGTYVVDNATSAPINLDLKMYCGSNRAGFTKMTVWSSTETTAIVACSVPTASVVLESVREGLFKPVATLACETESVTYYYKGGDAADWTAIASSTFEPTKKAEYQIKATATGYADSEPITLCLAKLYALKTTVADLTTDEAFTAATKDNNGFSWANANYVKISGLPEDQVYGRISSATAISGLSLQNNNLDARYSFAKGYGLACNYGYWVKTTGATAYDFAEYEVYQSDKAITAETQKVIVYNPNNTAYNFKPIKAVRLYEPVELMSITIPEIGYATFSCATAVDFTGSGLTAYYATADGDNVDFENAITNPAAETGLLLRGDAGTYEVIQTATGTDVSSVNLLQACLEEKTVGVTAGCDYGKVFILSKHNGKTGFFRSDNGRTLQAGKSYLYIDNPSTARQLNGFPFDEATSVADVISKTEDVKDSVYDLQGRRVAQPSKGLYILRSAQGRLQGKNGKKIIKK